MPTCAVISGYSLSANISLETRMHMSTGLGVPHLHMK